MTVSSQISEESYGPSAGTVLPLPFRFFNNSEISVTKVDDTTGATTVLTLGVDYTLTGAGEPEVNGNATGTVVLSAAIPAGFHYVVTRTLALEQLTDLINQGKFFPEIHESTFDRLVMMIQQLAQGALNSLQKTVGGFFWDFLGLRAINLGDPVNGKDAANKDYVDTAAANSSSRAVRVQAPETIPPLPSAAVRAGKMLSFDSSGNPQVVVPDPGSASALALLLADTSDPSKGASAIGRGIQCIGSVTALRALLKTTPSQFAFLTGYYAQGDGGGGLYWLDAADSTSTDNGGTIIVATDGGRWKLADTKNVTVKQFGAKGDGSTNDTARIQAAINWAGTFATAFGYTLLFPRGDYLYSSLTMDKAHVKLEGSGDVRLIKTTATNAGLVIGGQASRIYGNGVTGISFSSNVVGTSGAAVHAINCGQMSFEDVTITNFPASPYNGVLLENVTQATFNDFSATQCVNEGFAASDCVDIYVDTSRSDANGGNGFAFRTVSGLYLSQCTAWNNALQGYLIENTVVTPIAANGNLFHFYTNCIADTSGQHNWLIKNLGSSQMTGCWGSSQRVGAANTWCGIAISSCNGLDLNGCVALNNNSDGLLILNSSIDIKVNGGRFAHNGVGAGASSRYGVHIGASCEVVLDSASMTDYAAGTGPDPKYQTYGLKVDGSVAALTVTSCNMVGNLTGPYVFDSTPTYFAESLNRTGEATEIASANTVNLPMFGSVFGITGTTTVNSISVQWNGRRVTLITRAACTIADTGTLRLAGNFVGAANGTLSLAGDGTGWYETSRSLN